MAPAERIVLVHGFTQTGRSWAEVASDLDRDFQVLSPDAPSHGSLASAPAPDLPAAAQVIGSAGGRATYAGYSMGGRICLQLALDRPDLVERLVLVSTSPGIEDDAERAARRAADGRLADRLDPPGGAAGPLAAPLALDAFLAEWLSGPLFAHLEPAQAGVEARLANTPAGLAASLRTLGTGAMAPLWARLGELSIPVLLVTGALDEKFVTLARRTADLVAGSRLEVVPRAGHVVPFELPEVFAGLVRHFVAGT